MNPFALAYRQQQQLFLFDRSYLASVLFATGGLSALVAQFAVQFFVTPSAAMAITIFILALSALLLWAIAGESYADWRSAALGIAPAFILGASLSDNSLAYDYLTSVIIAEALLLIYKKIRAHRLLWGILLCALSYILAGPASLIFIVGASPLCILPLAACALAAYFSADVATLADAFTPSFHYRIDADMPAVHWAGWLAVMLALFFARISAYLASRSRPAAHRFRLIAGLALLSLCIAASVFISRRFSDDGHNVSCEFEHYVAAEDWDGLIASAKKQAWSPATANYLYLAYAKKGQQPDYLFKQENYGVSSLLYLPQARTVDVRLAHIMYAMGNIAAAQNVAFNALFTTEGIAPQMLRLNIKIELIRGSYEIAEKYISLLEKSLYYRRWASSMRRFLYNDAVVEADPELGTARRSMRTSEGFVMDGNPVDELMRVVRANPADRGAMQYALSFLLLSKDLPALLRFVDSYWGTPALSALPVPVQEALVFYSEYSRNFPGVEPVSLEWCAAHGVEREAYERFLKYQQASLQNGGNCPRGFASSYWNYLTSSQE